jgi:hypothetical protein
MAENRGVGGDEMVVTPGGPRRRALVHKINQGEIVRAGEDGKIEIVDEEDRVLRDITPPPTEPGPFGAGWICNTSWAVAGGATFTSFSTTWTVPEAPTTQSGQTIFLFNGLQTVVGGSNPATSGGHILQPVLQWGSSFAGGGNYWSIASWFAGVPGQSAALSAATPVKVGDRLVGVMTYYPRTFARPARYISSFQGYPSSSLAVQMPAPYACVETLEAYGITACSDYPSSVSAVMGSIDIQVDGATPDLSWSVNDTITDCNQHVAVNVDGATNGEVELFFRLPLPLPLPVNCPELAIVIGNLQRTILSVEAAPQTPGTTARLHALELELAGLQRTYAADCHG